MKKGFTLVELLAVIVILGFIAVIAIPSIQDVLYKSQDNAYKMLMTEMKETATDYFYDRDMDSTLVEDYPVSVYLSNLFDDGYLEEPITDPRNNNLISRQSYFVFRLESGQIKIEDHIIFKEQ